MKKFLLIMLITVLSCSTLFAEFNWTDEEYGYVLSAPFRKTSARVMAMGGAGIAIQNNADALYMNPASLGAKGLVFNIPNVAFTLYNIKDFNDMGLIDSIIEDPESVLDSVGDMINSDLLDYGRNNLAKIDAGIGFKAGRFALAVDTQVNLNLYNSVGGFEYLNIIPQVDVAFTTGLGFRFLRDEAINFDVGVSLGLNLRAFTQAVSFETFSDAMTGDSNFEDVLNGYVTALGWAMPLSIGFNANFPFGFTVSAVASNIQLINGGYNYKRTTFNAIEDDPMGEIFSAIGADEFTAKSDMNLALGVGWAPDLGGWEWLADPTVAIDFVDLIGLFDDFSLNSFLARLKMGAEIKLFKVLELRGGLNGGYVSLGLGVDLFKVIHLEASYYWNEFGENLGDKDVDAFTIRANIFWE